MDGEIKELGDILCVYVEAIEDKKKDTASKEEKSEAEYENLSQSYVY